MNNADEVHEVSNLLRHVVKDSAHLLAAEITMWIQQNLKVKSAEDVVQLTSLMSISPSLATHGLLSMVLDAEDSISPEWKVSF